MKKHNPEAKFSALQISRNAPVSLHRDSHNAKHCCNCVCGFGDVKKGQLWIEDEKVLEEGTEVVEQSYGKKVLPKKLVDVRWNFTSFFPRKLHGPMPWKGNRVSLTGYTPVLMERLSYKDRCFLLQCKFPLQEPQAEEGEKGKWLKVTLKETSLDDIADEADYAEWEGTHTTTDGYPAHSAETELAQLKDCDGLRPLKFRVIPKSTGKDGSTCWMK